ncbi:hypothetical protein FBZ93_11922 [Bradyrhizobium macuxiense]|uniref:Uncharacterized protein n=1 Tax=Bradyrhizobium macuxiense TaxID=1755647 RepID=A0A560KXQ7_9BRAD|nr:hypothetical protein FBZ93_11922 [Bradyrhizobium macuxiense]
MIRKSAKRLSEKFMPNRNLERDEGLTHRALATARIFPLAFPPEGD